MHASTMLWIAGGALMIGVIGAIVFTRRRPSDDLGSVSAAWTMEHSVGYRKAIGMVTDAPDKPGRCAWARLTSPWCFDRDDILNEQERLLAGQQLAAYIDTDS